MTRQAHAQNRCAYGVKNILEALRREGARTSKRRCGRLMREIGISGVLKRKKSPRTTARGQRDRHADDLVRRGLTASAPNRLWSADITYVKTHAGWLYLAVVLDVFSRAIVGWSMSRSLAAGLVDDALRMGLGRRRPQEGLVHHSDKGSRYCSLLLGKTLREHGIQPSMGAVASPWDNAVTESLIPTIKAECTDIRAYGSVEEAVLDIFDYIEVFYNRARLHSALGMMSPMEFEEAYYQRSALAG